MRKLLCGLLIVGAIIAFPAAASACDGYDMVYGNKWLGIGQGCKAPPDICIAGRRIRVRIKGVGPREVLFGLCGGIPLAVAVVVGLSLIVSRAVERATKLKRGQEPFSARNCRQAQKALEKA